MSLDGAEHIICVDYKSTSVRSALTYHQKTRHERFRDIPHGEEDVGSRFLRKYCRKPT